MTDMIQRMHHAALAMEAQMPGNRRIASIPSTEERDCALLRRYASTGSQDAFAQIVYQHAGWVYHTCRRALGDGHLAEDATQAVFLLLAHKASSMTPQTHIGAWLSQTCRHVLADVRKNRARYGRRQEMAREMAIHRSFAAEHPQDPIDPHLAEALDDALATLRDGDRQAIMMRFYDGLSVGEMADRLGLDPETAKKRLTRALSRLRAQLAGKVRGRKAVPPLSILVLFLRSRSAEAVSADLATAIARAATVPGATSVAAEMMVAGASIARSLAATRLWATLNLIQTPAIGIALGAMLLSTWQPTDTPLSAARRTPSAMVARATPTPTAPQQQAIVRTAETGSSVASEGEPMPGDRFESADRPGTKASEGTRDEPIPLALNGTSAPAIGGSGIVMVAAGGPAVARPTLAAPVIHAPLPAQAPAAKPALVRSTSAGAAGDKSRPEEVTADSSPDRPTRKHDEPAAAPGRLAPIPTPANAIARARLLAGPRQAGPRRDNPSAVGADAHPARASLPPRRAMAEFLPLADRPREKAQHGPKWLESLALELPLAAGQGAFASSDPLVITDELLLPMHQPRGLGWLDRPPGWHGGHGRSTDLAARHLSLNSNATLVPEPSLTGLCLGVCGFIAARRRRH